jgi:hypothetical protein
MVLPMVVVAPWMSMIRRMPTIHLMAPVQAIHWAGLRQMSAMGQVVHQQHTRSSSALLS